MPDGLTEREKEILAFESQDWREAGAKETAAYEQFGLRWIRYYRELNRIIDLPAADAYNPLLVRRLRRLRAEMIAHKGRAA